MKRKFLFFLIVFSLFGSNLAGQDSYHFEISLRSEYFEHYVNDLVAYIVLPNVNIWGWLEVTITTSYSHQRSTGKLVKRFQIGHNPGGYFHQKTEVPVAFGDVANIWAISDFDHDNNRIAIYHLTPAGNYIYVRIEGLLHSSSSVTSIVENTYITSPQVVSNNVQRHYTSIMQDKVGIGTLDPTSELSVNGKITTKEVEVTLEDWPDHVFGEGYKLKSLDQVEEFINENKHLPDIPTAGEVLEDGLNLGKMNAKLLLKIEELTLYIIGQEKRIKKLEKEIEKLKSTVK